jgi:hypothetical protein
MKRLSRRCAVFLAAMSPALAVSIHPAIADADLVLLELGRQFDTISAQIDHELHTEWETLNEFDRILQQILCTPATTLEGLLVKARAGCWVLLGDFESADESAAGAPMAFSIMRDLIRLGAPHLENPGALRRLIQQTEDGTD